MSEADKLNVDSIIQRLLEGTVCISQYFGIWPSRWAGPVNKCSSFFLPLFRIMNIDFDNISDIFFVFYFS